MENAFLALAYDGGASKKVDKFLENTMLAEVDNSLLDLQDQFDDVLKEDVIRLLE